MTERSSIRLTKRSVDALSVPSGDTVVWDRDLPGFGVRVYATGRKVWCIQARKRGGSPKRLGLGRVGELTVDEARKKAVKVIDRIRRGLDPDAPPEVKEPTVADLAEQYMESHARVNCKPGTIRNIDISLRLYIVPELGGYRLSEVTPSLVAAFHHGMRDRPTQANRTVKTLAGMFRHAETWGWTETARNPCRSVKRYREEPRERFLTREEYRKLGDALTKAERDGSVSVYAVAAIRLLMLTGCRRGEILCLKWDDIDRATGKIRIADGKAGPRNAPLTPAVERVLAGIPRRDGNPWVIQGKRPGGQYHGLGRIWPRVLEKAGLEHLRIHDLRHSYASRALALGEGLTTIGKLLGHRKIQTTARYAHLMRDAERESAARVGESIGASISRKSGTAGRERAAKRGKMEKTDKAA